MNTGKSDDCCSDQHCESGRRNRFFRNKKITPDTWQVEQDYFQQRRRLINRAVHGWGVVYGFDIASAEDDRCTGDGGRTLLIQPGFALDRCGRELVQAGKLPVTLADCLLFDEKGQRIESTANFTPEAMKGKCLLLKAHYAERLIAPVPVRDPCQCDNTEWDNICETIQYSLTLIPCDRCCDQDGCGLDCDCSRGPCCPESQHKPTQRGGCRCLCENSLDDPAPACCALSAIGKTLRADLRQGVSIACVTLQPDRCESWTFGEAVDVCGPRRLVKRNDLLFDLIRGCDLTRIIETSWGDWHRNPNGLVPFEQFAAKFGAPDGNGMNRTDFAIKFSREVDVSTLTRDAFAMTLIARDDEDGWGRTLRVPIVDIEVDDPAQAYSWSARILVDADWAKGALDSISVFGSGVTRFEITVRGDYLLDCNGQMVDANARGREPYPTGNGTPGDAFFSTFLIEKMEITSTKPNTKRGI